jgi:CelD/BcsL family acetyltransferase involved in cellulose biosynthesis
VRVEVAVFDDLQAVEQPWRAFEQQADCTAFQVFDWLAAWQRHIGAQGGFRPAVVLGKLAGGEPLFILPFAIGPCGPFRRLTWLGSDLCDYNAPMLATDFVRHVAPSQFPAVWLAVIEAIRSNPSLNFDFVDLRKMPERIGAQRNPFLDLAVTPNPSGAYRTTLDADWQTFYGRRSSATRRRDRSKVRRLGEFGEVRFIEPKADCDVESSLHALFEQKARVLARRGIADLFARPGYRDFFRDVATNPALKQLVHVSRLDVGAEVGSASLGLTFRQCYYHLLTSYQEGELGRFGPGAAHLRELMRAAIERGFRMFDFTIGDEPYKREWCGDANTLHDHIAAVRLRGVPIVMSCNAFFRVKRLIKQTPMLWHAFGKVRSMAGTFR